MVGLPREQRIGRYELLIELGRGGMAELFLGMLTGAGGFAKLVAIKRILPHLAGDAQFKQMFLEEGRIAAHLSHPNVCQVFELEEHDGELYLAMEYLDGVSWEHLLAAAPRDRLLALMAGVLAQAAEGLHYAHMLRGVDGKPTPVIHRDVSPQNLFVTVDGVCKVLDFGVSKMMTDGPRTQSGVIKGKLPYMAPEQIRGEPIDARADVFSLGVVAWEALAGTRLYQRDTDYQIWKAITEQDAAPLTSRWPSCPPALAAVVARALSRDANGRQPSARVFADELRAAVGTVASIADIAEVVRTWCADRIADRARQVATAASARRDLDPAASDTIQKRAHETVSMLMRRDSVAIVRPDRLPTTDPDAAMTTPFPSGEQRILTDVTHEDLRPPRSHARTAIIAALAAAAVTAVVVVAVTRTSEPKRTNVVEAPRDATERDPWTPPDAPRNPETVELEQRLAQARDVLVATSKWAHSVRDGIDARPATTDADATADTKKAPKAPRTTPPRTGSAAPASEPGTFSISSEPFATIYVDGKLLDNTPVFEVPLAAGPHHVRAVLEDGRKRELDIVIRAGELTNKGTLAW